MLFIRSSFIYIYMNPHSCIGSTQLWPRRIYANEELNSSQASIDNKWAYLTYGAKYYDPLMDSIRAFLKESSKRVTGWAKIRLFHGQMLCVACDSPYSLLDTKMAGFDQDFGAFNVGSSPGFIELWNLPQKTAYARGKEGAAAAGEKEVKQGAFQAWQAKAGEDCSEKNA